MDPTDSPPTTETTVAARPPGARLAFLLLAFGLASIAAFLAWQGLQRPSGAVDGGGMVIIAIEGMSCVGCAGAVTARLEEIPGVTSVEVDYDHRLARIRLADDRVEPSTLLAAIRDAGYGARLQR